MNSTQLVESILPYIYKKANKYAKGCPEIAEELVSEGTIGALEAAKTWDESKGKFITYADDAITWAMCAYFKRQTRKGWNILNNCEDDIDLDYLPSTQPTQYDDVCAEELNQICLSLRDTQKETIMLYKDCDGSPKRFAHKLGISEQAVNQRLRIIVRDIQQQL